MNSKVVLLAFLVLLELAQLGEAQSGRRRCQIRRRLRFETIREARLRRQAEKCICIPHQPRCKRITANHERLKGAIRDLIGRNSVLNIPASLRLTFHSCVGLSRCDGCIDPNSLNNLGLRAVYDDAIRLWNVLGRPYSFADFVVLIGNVAVEMGMEQEGGPGARTIPFRTGRVTCSRKRRYMPGHTFPQGQDPRSLEFLQNEFGVTRKLAIALLGGHSLGQCFRNNSGFIGPWDRTPGILDNAYYISLQDTEWELTEAANDFTQWSFDGRMMLHSDVSLIKNLNIRSGQRPSCHFSSDCPANFEGAAQVKIYAENQALWADDFVTAYLLMVQH